MNLKKLKMKPFCRYVRNNSIYEYLGDCNFKNAITGQVGVVEESKAKDIFRFNIELSQMVQDYPEVENLIKFLKLKFEIKS